MKLLDETKQEMQAALDHLASELKTIRSGRAHPGLLERVMVELYGSEVKLTQAATITASEARQLVVTPFDPSTTSTVAKAIEKANLSVQVVAEGNVVRVVVPPMDEQARKERAKQCARMGEECKVSVRNVRRKFNDQAKKKKSAGEMTEDEVKRAEKKIQELTDEFVKKIDQACAIKEKEILQV